MTQGAMPPRVASDARGLRTTYEEIAVGEDLGTIPWSVTQTQIGVICESDDDYHTWYSVDSPFGGVVAPVMIGYPPVRLLFSARYNVRGLFYAYDVENINPIRPDKPMFLKGDISEKWTKRDREYVAYEARCVDEDGLEIFRTRRAHVLDFIPMSSPRTASGVDSGAAQTPEVRRDPLPEPKTQPPAPRETVHAIITPDVPIGWNLPLVCRQMSIEQFRDRHRLLYGENVWPEANLHADLEAARREGLSEPVASAPTIFALVTRAMMTTFAEGWIQGGTASLKMIKPVYARNFLTAKGIVTEKQPEGDRTRITCEVWVEDETGRKVVVGSASGVLS